MRLFQSKIRLLDKGLILKTRFKAKDMHNAIIKVHDMMEEYDDKNKKPQTELVDIREIKIAQTSNTLTGLQILELWRAQAKIDKVIHEMRKSDLYREDEYRKLTTMSEELEIITVRWFNNGK